MPAVSARQLVTTALRLIGVASAEQSLSADMAESGLDALNSLLDSWSNDRLLAYTRPKIALSLVAGKQTYTWGETTPAADIPFPPPVRLELCVLAIDTTSPGLEWQVQVLNQEEYETQIWLKTLQSTYVEMVYLEKSQPVSVLHCWPVPSQVTTLFLLPWQAHAPYEHYDAVLDWPNGYQRAITWNLACEIAPQYGIEPSPTIMRTADEAKRAIFPLNLELGRLRLDPGRRVGVSGHGYNPAFLRGD